MSIPNVPLIDIAGRGGPGALLMQSDANMLVITASGRDDLALEILSRTARGNCIWPNDAPVCLALMNKMAMIRNFPLARFELASSK